MLVQSAFLLSAAQSATTTNAVLDWSDFNLTPISHSGRALAAIEFVAVNIGKCVIERPDPVLWVRAFVQLRQASSVHADLAKRLTELELSTERLELSHDTFSRNTRNQLRQVFDALRELTTPPEPPKRPIGFVTHEDKSKGSKSAQGKKT